MTPATERVQSDPRAAVADRSRAIASLILSAAALAVFAAYAALLPSLRALRSNVVAYFVMRLAPAAALHVIALLLVSLRWRGRAAAALLFWTISLAVFLAIGWHFALGFLLAAAAALALIAVGTGPALAIVPAESAGWPTRLGIGILLASFAGSVLAWAGVFRWWSMALLLAPLAIFALRRERFDLARVRSWLEPWDLPRALAGEGLFLLFLFLFVAASAPETKSDAMRIYWPYTHWLAYLGRLPDMPFQWSYIIPQPGVTYAASVLDWFGPFAVRYSMALALLALVGVAAGASLLARPAAAALAVLVASAPIVLWTTASLYQDTFVSLTVLLLAAVCVRGKDPGSAAHWIGVGALLGLCWCAKFSSLGFAIPLAGWAFLRGRAAGWGRNAARALGLGGAGAIAVALPWLAHSYDQSSNPLFPFFQNVFPSPLWPTSLTALGSDLLSHFRIGPGAARFLLAPFRLTFDTGRYVEGPDGFLGAGFLILLAMAVFVAARGKTESRVLVAAGAIGIAFVWAQTGYVRYWLPGLWLLAAGACGEIEELTRGGWKNLVAVCFALLVAFLQIPFAMVPDWGDPDGWPWKLYRGAVTEERYLAGIPGIRALRRMAESGRWPRFWYTGMESVANIEAAPIMAELWELGVHGAKDADSIARYVSLAGSDFWVVREDSMGARYLTDLGVARRFWTEERLFASDGPVRIYRIPRE